MTQEWQPIETAPKDGAILIYFADGRIDPITAMDILNDAALLTDESHCWLFTCDPQPNVFCGFEAYPTHWMPLPQPPKVTK